MPVKHNNKTYCLAYTVDSQSGGGSDNELQQKVIDRVNYRPLDIISSLGIHEGVYKCTFYTDKPLTIEMNAGAIYAVEQNGIVIPMNVNTLSVASGKTVIYAEWFGASFSDTTANIVMYIEGGSSNTPIGWQRQHTGKIDIIVCDVCCCWINPSPNAVSNCWSYDINNKGWQGNYYPSSNAGGKLVYGNHSFDVLWVDTIDDVEEGNPITVESYVPVNRIDSFVDKINNSGKTSGIVDEIMSNVYTYTYMDFESDGYTPRVNGITKYNPI